MAASRIRVHDCFDVLAGESKPPKCKCPNVIDPEAARELVANGKARVLSPRSIVSLAVHNSVARIANGRIFAANQTDHEFVQEFRKLFADVKLSDADILARVKNPEKFNGSATDEVLLRLSAHYWNKVLENQGLAESRGEFLADAPHGKGRLISGGYDSEKISRVHAHNGRDGGRRVKTANFRKGAFNDGILSSAGFGPDKFGTEDSQKTPNGRAARDRLQSGYRIYLRWEVGQIALMVLCLQAKGYSQEKIMIEISQSLQPALKKKKVTLVCRGCGTQAERTLASPPDVVVPENQPFVCKDCVRPSKGRRIPTGEARILKPEALTALNKQLNTPALPAQAIDPETLMAEVADQAAEIAAVLPGVN